MFPFLVVVHPENEQDRDLASPFYRRGVGAAWKHFQSYDLRSRKVSAVGGVFRRREHSTIMMYPLSLTCSRQGG